MNRQHVRSLALVALVAGVIAAPGGPAGAGVRADFTCQGLPATIVGTVEDDLLTGTPGPDVIVALAGDDVVNAGGGDDVVCGGRGTDRLNGQDGNDRLFGERNGLRPSEDRPATNVGDVLAGGAGDDYLDPGWDRVTDVGGGFLPDTISFRDSLTGVVVDLEQGSAEGEGVDTLVIEGRVDVHGSDHDDVILGTHRTDWIISFSGDDLVDGRGGRDGLIDQLDVGSADSTRDDDFFIGGRGNDYLEPGRGADTVRGGQGDDRVEDLWGPSSVQGGAGADEITVAVIVDQDPGDLVTHAAGGRGLDELNVEVARAGTLVRTSAGVLDLQVGRIRALVDGDVDAAVAAGTVSGVEVVAVPEGSWRVRGSRHDETVWGPFLPQSQLVAHMGGGRDRVFGGPGDDEIDGGAGRDMARPGNGYDRCRSVERQPAQDRCED